MVFRGYKFLQKVSIDLIVHDESVHCILHLIEDGISVLEVLSVKNAKI